MVCIKMSSISVGVHRDCRLWRSCQQLFHPAVGTARLLSDQLGFQDDLSRTEALLVLTMRLHI
jgi:hypothetical protein